MASITFKPVQEELKDTNTAGAPAGFGIPGVGVGIMHPTLANKFRMIYGDIKRRAMLTMQTVRVRTDMVKGTMTCEIEQPTACAQEMINLIAEMVRGNVDLRLQMMDGDEGVTGEIRGFGKLVQHELLMDYSLSETAMHILTFEFKPSVC